MYFSILLPSQQLYHAVLSGRLDAAEHQRLRGSLRSAAVCCVEPAPIGPVAPLTSSASSALQDITARRVSTKELP